MEEDMYSPKIAEHLIPPIYRLARARGQHMTTVVNEALAQYLAGQPNHMAQDANRYREAAVNHTGAGPSRQSAPEAAVRTRSQQVAR